MRAWETKAELDALWKKLILLVYYEFCYKQKNQEMWEAGLNVMNRIGG